MKIGICLGVNGLAEPKSIKIKGNYGFALRCSSFQGNVFIKYKLVF